MDRQKRYRVAPEKTNGISLCVQQQRGSSFSGQFLDMSLDKIGVCSIDSSFDMPSPPALAIGEEVELALTFVDTPKSLVASAMVVGRTDKDHSTEYGFRFIDPQKVASQLSSELSRLFNQRGSYRVPPDLDAHVEVTLEGGAESTRVEAELVDISTSGVGLRVAAHVEVGLVAAKRIKVCISFPDSREPLNLVGVIRNRHLVGASGAVIQYGIQFDWEGTHNAERQQGAIVKYVMMQQRNHLRKSTAHLRHGMTGTLRLPAVAEPIATRVARRVTRFVNNLMKE